MAWFGEGLSSLKGQLTNFAKGVLSEDGDNETGEAKKTNVEPERTEVTDGPPSADTRPALQPVEIKPKDGHTSSIGSTQSWNEVFHSADKFLGQDSPIEGFETWPNNEKEPQKKEERTASPQKEVHMEKDVASMIPRGIVDFFQLNQNQEEKAPSTGSGDNVHFVSKETQTVETTVRNEMKEQLIQLQGSNQRLTQENASLGATITSLNRMVQDLESQIAVSQDENANLSTGLEELDIQHQLAIEQIIVVKDETQKQYEILKLKYKELEENYEELVKSKEKLVNKPNLPSISEEESEKDLEKISDPKHRELVRELKERDDELQVLESENANLRTTVKELTAQIDKYNENLPPIQENSEEIEILEQNMISLENEVVALREVRSNLETELGTTRDKINELSKAVQITKAMLKNQDNLQVEIVNLTEKNVENERVLNYLTRENSDLKVQNDEIRETLQLQMDTNLAKKQSIINKLNDDLTILNENLNSKSHEYTNLEAENSNLIRKFQQLENQLKKVDLELENAQKDGEIKDRKMCEILLESTAVEEELKMLREDSEKRYNFLNQDFMYYKKEVEKELNKKDEIIKNLNIQKNDAELKFKLKFNDETTNRKFEDENYQTSESKTKYEDLVDKDLVDKFEEAKLTIDSLQKELESVMNKKEEVLQECMLKQNEIEEWKNKESEVIAPLEEKIENLQKEIEGLRNVSQELEILKDISRQKDLEFKNQINSKEEEINRVKVLLNESKSFKDRCHILETELNGKLMEREKEIETLKHSELDLRGTIEVTTKELLDSKGEIEKYFLQNQSLNQQILLLNESFEKLRNENETLLKKNDELMREKDQQVIERMESDSKLAMDNENLLKRISYYEENVENINTKINQTTSENQNLKDQLCSLQNSNKDWENKHNALYQDKETQQQKLIADIRELQEKCSQLEERNIYLLGSSEAREAEFSTLNAEYQKLNEVLHKELQENEQILIDKIELNNKYGNLEKLYKEKASYIENTEASYDKQIKMQKQEIESLRNQLEYASQLLSVVDRQEAEGQPSADGSSSQQKLCPEGCAQTQEELARLSEALLNEQSEKKLLLSQVEDITERYGKAEAQLVTLKRHLVEVEDNYSGELMIARDKLNDLQTKLTQADERVRSSSNAYTSASIRANQQVESLTLQVKSLTEQNDKLESELSKAEDKAHRQAAAVTNLQAVLHQFQRDKQKDIDLETERIRQTLKESYGKNDLLNAEIKQLQEQLTEAKKGLSAATRLTEQLDKKSETITALKHQVLELTDKIKQGEEKLKAAQSTGEGKVDRYLVKNLLVGYMCAPAKNRDQVLRVIATVLDLNKEERQKVGLEPGGSLQQQSLSEAFIRFLETESQPKPKVLLPLAQSESSSPSRRISLPGNSSLLLTDDLPNLPHFTLGRNPGSILKDVLKDRNS